MSNSSRKRSFEVSSVMINITILLWKPVLDTYGQCNKLMNKIYNIYLNIYFNLLMEEAWIKIFQCSTNWLSDGYVKFWKLCTGRDIMVKPRNYLADLQRVCTFSAGHQSWTWHLERGDLEKEKCKVRIAVTVSFSSKQSYIRLIQICFITKSYKGD